MTASDETVDRIGLYVAPQVWPFVSALVNGFRGGPDASGTIVGSAETIQIDRLSDSEGAERLLDRHWIIYRRNDSSSRRDAERSFFEAIAGNYESEVDTGRNRANFRLLMQCAGVATGHRVLDFGCGPGLSVRAADGVELIGCDVSSEMRRRAETRGLLVMSPETLHGLADTFDAAVASYVLHLAVPIDDWIAAGRCVRVGGNLAANFHKGNGLVAVEEALLKDDTFALLEARSFEHDLHGPIRIWKRVR